jgi:uncharacterized protein YeaO (DUF488 family)
MISIRRIYEPPAPEDGTRILIDRLWPRGLSKDSAKVDVWLKEVAPSHELRKKWGEFKKRYFKELDDKKELIRLVLEKTKEGNVTLLFGAREERYNNAVALREYVESKERR